MSKGSVWDAEKRSKCKNLYLKGIRDGKVQEHNDLDGKITGWNMVLKRDGLYSEDQFEELQKEYQDKLGLTWDVMLGFNDTYGIAVRKEIADQYGLKTYSDLQKVNGKLVFGAEYDFFERQDGYDKLCSTYGLTFKSTSDMDMGLKYQAINSGKIDIMPVNTTDGQLSQANVTVLVVRKLIGYTN